MTPANSQISPELFLCDVCCRADRDVYLKWVEKMGHIEDENPCVSVGGMVCDVGMNIEIVDPLNDCVTNYSKRACRDSNGINFHAAIDGCEMKSSILLELTRRWEQDSAEPQCQNGSEEAKIGNAIAKGERQAKRECADALKMLVYLLGEKSE